MIFERKSYSLSFVLFYASLCCVDGGLTVAFNKPLPSLRREDYGPSTDIRLPVGQGQHTPLSRAVSNETSPSKQVVESFHVHTDIRYRFATTRMSSLVRNTAGTSREMTFDVILPKEAFIVSFTMSIDGQTYPGQVKKKREAKKQYRKSKRKGENAGHIRQSPRHSNRFDVSVNVAAGAAVNFTLIYQQVLSRKFGVYQHMMHVDPGQPVKDFKVEIFIQENRPISLVKIPRMRSGSIDSNKIKSDGLTTINRPSETTAHIQHTPSLQEQRKGRLSAQFVIQYDVEHSENGELLVADGFFLHLFSPKLRNRLPKDIIFVLDLSGSMKGTKMEQLKDAMWTIIEDLTEKDRFNILTFSYSVSKWRRVLAGVTPSVVEEAKRFVDAMVADGRTNINDGLLTALSELQGREMYKRAGMVFFLTDGEPTIGERDPIKIAENVRVNNTGEVSIYSLAFGDSADFESLKMISAQNGGFARKIYEASDAALQVESLYNEISVVAMKDVKVKYIQGVTKTTKKEFPFVYNGTEIAILGCYDLGATPSGRGEDFSFQAEIEGQDGAGEVDISLTIDDVGGITIDDDGSLNSFFTMPRDTSGILEKMWAFMTIKQMLAKKQAVRANKDKVKELNDKILEMSLLYNFVTPLTSMVVTKPDTTSPEETSLVDADQPVENSGHQTSKRSHKPIYSLRPHKHADLHSQSGGASGHKLVTQKRVIHPGPCITCFYDFPMSQNSDNEDQRSSNPTTQKTTSSSLPIEQEMKRERKTKRRKVKRRVKSILKSILLNSINHSVCFVPQYLPKGKYVLALHQTSSNAAADFKVELSTDCMKKCQIVVPKTLSLSSNNKTLSIDLTSLNTWKHTGQNSDFKIKFGKRKRMILRHKYGAVSITRRVKKMKALWSLKITAKKRAGYSGLMDCLVWGETEMRSHSYEQQHLKTCKKSKANLSLFLTKDLAERFKVDRNYGGK